MAKFTKSNRAILPDADRDWDSGISQSVNGGKFTNLQQGGPTGTDSVNYDQLQTKVSKSGDTMSGILNMGSNKITNLTAGSNAADAVRYDQLPTGTVDRLSRLSLVNISNTATSFPHTITAGYDNTWSWNMNTHATFASRRPPAGAQGAIVRLYLEADSWPGATAFTVYGAVNGEQIIELDQNYGYADNGCTNDIFALPGTTLTLRVWVTGGDANVDGACRFWHIGWYY